MNDFQSAMPDSGMVNNVIAICRDFSHFFYSLIGSLTSNGSNDEEQGRLQQEMESEIWRLRRLLRVALGGGVEQDIVGALRWLDSHGDQIERAVVVWVDLIESLVQVQERRYGKEAGLGAIKKAEIKEVLTDLLEAEKLRLPNIPQFAVAFVLEIFVDWVVDIVVLMANDNDLWTEDTSYTSIHSVLAVGRRWLGKMLRPVWLGILWLIVHLSHLFRSRALYSAELTAKVNAVKREGFPIGVQEVEDGAVKVIQWIPKHRQQLIAGSELIFGAVHDAEAYLELSGPEKRRYAQDLVVAVLKEMGLHEDMELLFAVVNSVVGAGIESTVHLFNKRGVFTHHAVTVQS